MNDEAAQQQESAELVTVGAYMDAATAGLARAALESAGMVAFLQGENANSLIPGAFLARLQVRPADVEAAREVLSASDLAPATEAEVTAAEEESEREAPGR